MVLAVAINSALCPLWAGIVGFKPFSPTTNRETIHRMETMHGAGNYKNSCESVDPAGFLFDIVLYNHA